MSVTFTEHELVSGCLKGKAAMQRALYQKFARTMLGICIRYTKDRMEAEDMLQQGFMKVFDHIKDFNGGSLEGWMKRIFIRESIDHFRRQQRSPMGNPSELMEHQSVGLEEITGQLAMEEIVNLIGSLPAGCKMVFNLYAVEGYTHKEIGDMLEISENTSKSQYSRAKDLLKEKIYARENG